MKRDFLTIDDLSNAEIERLLSLTFQIKREEVPLTEITCVGKEMVGLFFESSTRTRLSFEIAMHRLGGKATVVSDVQTTSLAKGETLADTARVVSGMCDLIVFRHPWDGAAQVLADYSRVPVINAGDGSHQHPTQTLVDLYTIWDYKGHLNKLRVGQDCKDHLNKLRVGLVGDLRHGRTVHSLAIALARFGAKKIFCLGLPELEMPKWTLERLARSQTTVVPVDYVESGLEPIIGELDVLYMTRVQKERLPKTVDYEAIKKSYVLEAEVLKKAKGDLLLLHPLPRTDELPRELDSDPRAKHFKQSDNGVPVRMALIAALLGRTEILESRPEPKYKTFNERCANPRCVTAHQDYVEPRFNCLPENRLACFYCGHLKSD